MDKDEMPTPFKHIVHKTTPVLISEGDLAMTVQQLDSPFPRTALRTESYWQIGCSMGRAKMPPCIPHPGVAEFSSEGIENQGYMNGWHYGRAQQFRDDEAKEQQGEWDGEQ